MVLYTTLHVLNHVPEKGSCNGSFTTQEAYIHSESTDYTGVFRTISIVLNLYTPI